MAKKKGRKSSRRTKRRRVSGDTSLAPAVVSGTRRRSKKRAAKKSRKRKRAKVGAVTGSNLGDVAVGAVLGAAVSYGVQKGVEKFAPGKENAAAIAKTAVGALTLVIGVAAKKKRPMVAGIGAGMMLQSGYKIAKSKGWINGMEEFISGVGAGNKDEMIIEMNGVTRNSTKFISGSSMVQPDIISGTEDSSSNAVYGTNQGTMPSIIS